MLQLQHVIQCTAPPSAEQTLCWLQLNFLSPPSPHLVTHWSYHHSADKANFKTLKAPVGLFLTGTASHPEAQNSFNTVRKLKAFCQVVLLNPKVDLPLTNIEESVISQMIRALNSVCKYSPASHTKNPTSSENLILSNIQLLLIQGVLSVSWMWQSITLALGTYTWEQEAQKFTFITEWTAQKGLWELPKSCCLLYTQ